jgi:hypothetical protein
MSLVCIAPDGSLEIWTHELHGWRFVFDLNWETYSLDAYLPGTIEFWGREVLGEL